MKYKARQYEVAFSRNKEILTTAKFFKCQSNRKTIPNVQKLREYICSSEGIY